MGSDWTKEFRDKLEDWRQPAPEGLWEAVSAEMGVTSKRRPVWKIFGWAAGVAAAAAVVTGVLFWGFGRWQDDGSDVSLVRGSSGEIFAQAITAGNDAEKAFDGESTGKRSGREFGESTGNASGKGSGGEKSGWDGEDCRSDVRNLTGMTTENGAGGDATETILNGEANGGDLSMIMKEQEGRLRKEKAEDAWNETAGHDWKKIMDEEVKTRLPRGGRVRVGAVVSGGNGESSHLDGYAGTAVATGMISTFGENPQAGIMLFNRTREVSTDTKYFQPVKAGGSVKWNFSGRWGLESGLYWSGLYSRTTSGSNSYFTRIRQELHYIGIPLNLTCDIWEAKGFTVYATVGGMMEKCIGGRLRTEYIYNNSSAAPESSVISEKELQWSAGLNVGAEYLFTKHIGIYLEPGAVWHFNNGSAIDNVYKARPFDFNLALGLRFAF